MSDDLLFMMGEYEARFPTNRQYATNHMWAQPREHFWQVGFTAYAVRLLQDVYFLDWSVDAGTTLRTKQQIGFIESKKAESDLFAPAPGLLLTLNEQLLADPSAINVDPYGQGWLLEMEIDAQQLLSAEDYLNHLTAVWEVTQRTIKGQLNQ